MTDLLVEHFPEVVDLDFTARMEDQLDDVAGGEREWVPMVRDFWEPFSAQVTEGREKIAKQVEVTDIPCPLTGDKGDMLIKRFGRNGWFLGCSGYPECKYTQPLPGEEPEEIPELPGVGEVCPLCGEGHLAAKRGRFGAVRRLRPLSGLPLHQEEPAAGQRTVRHLSAVRAGDGGDQARAARQAPVLGLRPLPGLRLRQLDAAGARCRRHGPHRRLSLRAAPLSRGGRGQALASAGGARG